MTDKRQKNNSDLSIKKFTFDKNFQEKIVQAMIMDRPWAIQFNEVLDVNYFNFAHLKLITDKYINHYSKHKEFPSMDLLMSMIKTDLKNNEDHALREQIKEFLINVEAKKDLGDLPYVKEKALDFCKRASTQIALEKSISYLATEKYEKIVEEIKKAINAGNPVSPGLELLDDIDARYSDTYRRTISTGIPELDQKKILNGGLGGGEIGFVVAPTGCHKKGTKILMYDGSVKNVEDIVVGEQLMGPDSQPRDVLQLIRGKEKMYEIIPTKGNSFIVNENHILSLRTYNKNKKEKIVNISVKDYLTKNKDFKHSYKLWRTGVEFTQTQNLSIDPYVLGLLLGDGYLKENRIELTTKDKVIKEIFYQYALKNGMDISEHHKKGSKAVGYYLTNNGKHNNPCVLSLKKMNLIGKKSDTKFIPQNYLTSSRKNRLELLAGLIDTDGSKHNNCYDYITKSEQLANDICFLSRSLGFAAYIKKCTKTCKTKTNLFTGKYYRICISGDTSQIPVKITNKKCSFRKQIKDVTQTGFKLKELNEDNFYGFTINKDHLYLLDDFTVNHNCGKSHVLVQIGAAALKQGYNVVHYTFELNERITGIRYDSNLTDIPSLDCFDNKEEIRKFYNENRSELGRLIVKYFPTGQASTQTLRAHLDKLQNKGFIPDIIIIDYAGIMRSADRNELLRLELKKVCEELRGLAGELDIPIWSAIQSNKEGANADIVDVTNMAESYGQAHVADFILGLSRQSAQKATGFGNLFIAKNRAGIDGIKYCVHLDTSRSKIRVLTDAEAIDFAHEKEEDALKLIRIKFKEVQEEKK